MAATLNLPLQFQHTAARRRLRGRVLPGLVSRRVSTHSRAEAAAKLPLKEQQELAVSTHSRAEAAAYPAVYYCRKARFQHTAARRRLHEIFIG